jgi:L-aminopeptidase/D-esterase-like protein
VKNSLTDIPGILVGHATDAEALTGCTVILCKKGAIGGVDQRGGAPGTRETDLLRPIHLVNQVNAILLTGGSAFGLDAASGVMRFLEEKSIGYNTGVAHVPIVPGAVLFDLAIGNPHVRPNAEMGYAACQNASENPPLLGNVGAGTGATVGKILGIRQAMKTGVGSASMEIGRGVIVGALVAVNAFGDVVDPQNGKIIAGTRSINKGKKKGGNQAYFADTLAVMRSFAGKTTLRFASKSNTVIGVVATNARLTKEEINKVSQMAQNGLAMTIRPAHTMFDGDTIFALSTQEKKGDVNIVGAFAVQVVAEAIISAVKSSKSAAGLPAYQDALQYE